VFRDINIVKGRLQDEGRSFKPCVHGCACFVPEPGRTYTFHGAVSFSECKIRQVGDDFLAMGGNIREKVTGFDAFKVATQAMRDSDKPIDKVKGFERNILTPLTEVIRMVRSKNPEYFENRLRDKIVLFVAFFGIEQQSLYLSVRSYKATVYNSIDVKVEPEGSTDCLTGCNTILALGETDAITDYLNTNPKPVLSVELVAKACSSRNRTNARICWTSNRHRPLGYKWCELG
jgi:hypothetical protein